MDGGINTRLQLQWVSHFVVSSSAQCNSFIFFSSQTNKISISFQMPIDDSSLWQGSCKPWYKYTDTHLSSKEAPIDIRAHFICILLSANVTEEIAQSSGLAPGVSSEHTLARWRRRCRFGDDFPINVNGQLE